MRLSGKRVLVAGGGGLGAAISAGFVDVGAQVFVVDKASAVVEQALATAGGSCEGSIADVSTREGSERAVEAALDHLGGIDVLVHAVGINRREAIVDISEESWQLTQDVNTASLLWLAQAAKPHLPEGSRIVVLSSVSGSLAHPHHGSYAAGKGAINQLVRVMAVEWASERIAVNAVAPAYTVTPLTAQYVSVPGRMEELVRAVPMGRLGTPEDIVGPVLLLASERAGYVTGQVLYVDGGRTLD
ncbi:SDR family oxidoreductase [Agromyces sp. LY-1358]|nr:SDR family oxidoreductase [Agromyces sp. LY-1358]